MTHAEMKRQVGYVQPEYQETCGSCRRCRRKGTHLRCGRWEFPVASDGICRNGYEKIEEPLNAEEHPLLVTYTDIDRLSHCIAGVPLVEPKLVEVVGEVGHD